MSNSQEMVIFHLMLLMVVVHYIDGNCKFELTMNSGVTAHP